MSCIIWTIAISKDRGCGIAKEEEEKEEKEGYNDCCCLHQLLIASCPRHWHVLPHELCVPPSTALQHSVEQPSEWAALLPEPSMCTKTSCCCSLPSPNKRRQTHKISRNTKETRHAYRSAHLAVRKEKAVLPTKHQTYLTSSEVLKGLKVTPLKWIFLLVPCCFIFKSPSLPAALPSFISC